MNKIKVNRILKQSLPFILTSVYFIILMLGSIAFSNQILKEEARLMNVLIASAFIISILIWIVSSSITKIKRNEKELNAIFHSMNSLIIEFDREGRYIKIPPINTAYLIRPREELINKTLFEVLPEAEAKLTHKAILRCLKTKKIVKFEYPILLGNKRRWFAARVSWKSNNRVIFHAFDITLQKNAREELIKKGIELRELNATKDKFFSIIAHDLKSPFNIILGYTELLNTSYDDFDEVEKRDLIDELDKSSKSVYKLLHNLLLWAQAQSKKNNIKKENLSLKDLVMESINAYLPIAANKDIHIDINIPEDLDIRAERLAIRTVIANLFDNAIKYTPKTGNISIDAKQINDVIEVRVSDTGMGIPPETQPKLFRIEESISTYGTEHEKGTGLGLILCKEFVEKQGGTIGMESSLGDASAGKPSGTSFYFKLPGVKGK